MNHMKAKYAGTGKGIAPIGVVEVFDEDGDAIRETHNMVVLDGQRIMMSLFLSKLIENGSPAGTGDEYIEAENIADNSLGISFAYEANPSTTVETMDADDIPSSAHDVTEGYSVEYSMAGTGVCLTLKTKLSGAKVHAFNEIMLMCKSTEGEKILFSRALIDPVFLGSDSSYMISYTLYF
jgi:hypothetical protein